MMLRFTFVQLLIIFLAGFLGEVATDIYVPHLPLLAGVFHVSYASAGMTITSNLIGFSISCLLFGTISDYRGRRYSLICSLLIFSSSSFLCMIASSFNQLLFFRFMQGLGSGATVSLGIAIINDVYRGNARVKMISLFGAVTALSPGIAPIISSWLISYNQGWRITFSIVTVLSFLCLISVYFKLPETAQGVYPSKKIAFDSILMSLKDALKIRDFLVFAAMYGILFASIWIFIADFPYVFRDILKFDMKYYGYTIMLDIFVYIFGTYLNRITVDRNGPEKNLLFGILYSIVFYLISLILVFYNFLLSSGVFLLLSHLGIAFIISNNIALATEKGKNIVGMLSSFVSAFGLVSGATGIWLFGLIDYTSPAFLTYFVGSGFVSVFIMLIIFILFSGRVKWVSVRRRDVL